ncbi:blue light receptor [Ceratobasidium sp. 394]|nr:blue light receptor [Ceratobasidium sp. 394]
MSLAALPSHTPHTVSTKPPPVFEFTKRKKWADILISELSGSLLLVLNPSAHILWASPAIAEQLGWRDEELLERPIRDILHDDDAPPFADHLKRAVETHSELFSYARLRSKFASPRGSHPTSPAHSPTAPTHSTSSLNPPAAPSTTTPLFELRGHAIYSKSSSQSSTGIGDAGPSTSASSSSSMNLESNLNPNPESEASCFIVMARPYPSRNTAMLDSFLELKIENERLRQQLLNLRTSGVPPSPVLASPAYPISQIAPASETPLLQPASALPSPIYPSASLGVASGDADAAFQPRSIHAMPQPPAATNIYYPTQTNRFGGPSFDAMYNPTSYGTGPTPNTSGVGASARRGSIAEEPVAESTEAGRSRKKPKKAHSAQEQYVCVTCGRTDSPEWRKGPLGAKTLCNACGLRWAKRNTKRKTDEFGGAEGGGG